MHILESIQVRLEDIQVICSSTALGKKFWWLTTLPRKRIFPLFYVNVYTYMLLFIKKYRESIIYLFI